MESGMKKRSGWGTLWKRYLAIAVFCAVFSLIYNHFAHEIRSSWMTFLCLWPLLPGAVPAFLQEKGILPVLSGPGEGEYAEETGFLRTDIYHFGIAAGTAASLLKGILEIAGTDSLYPDLLLYAGIVMLAVGTFFYLAGLHQKRTRG